MVETSHSFLLLLLAATSLFIANGCAEDSHDSLDDSDDGAGGEWSYIGQFGATAYSGNGLLVTDDTVHVYGDATSGGWITSIKDGQAVTRAVFAPVFSMFRTPQGRILVTALEDSTKTYTLHEANADMSLTPIALPANALIPVDVQPLAGGGFVGHCTSSVVCAGTDGLDTVSLGSWNNVHHLSGTRVDDIWGLSPNNEIMHWDGKTWTTEGLPPIGAYTGFMHAFSEKSVIAVGGGKGDGQATILHFDGECWRSLVPPGTETPPDMARGVPVTLSPNVWAG